MEPMLKSPMLEYFYKFDEQHKQPLNWDFFEINKKQDPQRLYALILADWQFRAENQDCVVIEVFGLRGSGKSLGTLDMAIRNGEIYGVPFDPKAIIYDKFAANEELRKKENRSTTIVDEFLRAYGEMSLNTENQLEEFKEQGRYTQKNVFWVSTKYRESSSGLAFESDGLAMERVNNPTCNQCPLYAACKANYFTTLCADQKTRLELKLEKPVPFWERTGYPVSFAFKVFYPHAFEKYVTYRGTIRVPMVDPKTARLYDERKRANIKRLENYESDRTKIIEDIAGRIIKDHWKEMIFYNHKTQSWKLGKQGRIEMFVTLSSHANQLTIGVKKFTLKEKVIMLLEDIVRKKNDEE